MNINKLNPYIRYAALHQIHIRRPKELNMCYDCRIFYAENAAGYITVNDKKYQITNTSAIFLPPSSKYFFEFDKNDDFKMLVFDFDLVSDFSYLSSSLRTATEKTFDKSKMPMYSLPEVLSKPIIKNIPQIHARLSKTIDIFLKKEEYYREISSAYLKLCLIEFITQNEMDTTNQLCKNIINYIHDNSHNSALTNLSVAKHFSYHPHYLSSMIKKETGKTLHQYIISCRTQTAKNLLLSTGYSIEEIAWKSGFESSAYFIKVFKENTGITPKKYRTKKQHTEL